MKWIWIFGNSIAICEFDNLKLSPIALKQRLNEMDLNITVGKDPFSLGENQLITVAVLNSSTGKELDSRFYGTWT